MRISPKHKKLTPKNYHDLTFVLLGSVRIKASHKMLMKLTPADRDGVDGGGVAVAVAVVLVTTSISGSPNKNAAFPFATSSNAVLESSS